MSNNARNRRGFPDGHRFAFTIFDDTDNATIENVAPMYDLLAECGMRTTKSVWAYPSRDRFDGESLEDPRYLTFLKELEQRGFEIAWHGAGSGSFDRAEIIAGLQRFSDVFGRYPRLYANHSRNPENLYWNEARFLPPLSWAYALLMRIRGLRAEGERPGSKHFWGDLAKQHIRYIRNFTTTEIDTLRFDPRMPYSIDRKAAFSNLWFSSSDGHTIEEFLSLLAPANLDRLATQGGACIVYTHFASGFCTNGSVDTRVVDRLRDLSARGGWFVPVGTLLDYLSHGVSTADPGLLYEYRLNLRWLVARIAKRLRFGR